MSGQREHQPDNHLSDELLSAYLDGQMTAAERARVDAHLAGCPACAGELRVLQATVGVLRELPPAPLPRAFTIPADVPARVPARRPSLWDALTRGWGYRALQGATALAMMLLMTLCAGDLLQTLFTARVPLAMPLTGASEGAYPTQTHDESLLAVAPSPTVPAYGVRQTTAAARPAAESTAAATQAPAPTRPPKVSSPAPSNREVASQTPVPQVGGAAQTETPTSVPPAPMAPETPSPTAPTTPSPSSAKVTGGPTPTPAEAWRAQVVPSATAETDTATIPTEEARTPTAVASYQEPSPAPPQPDRVAQPQQMDPARLAVCGIESLLLAIAGGLLLTTGLAWWTRRGR